MKLFKVKISTFLILLCSILSASKISEAFEALSVHDYFKAKKLFYSINKKKFNPYASYGLAIIFNRNNNPFYNVDSAVKYIHISLNSLDAKACDPLPAGFSINRENISQLLDSIAHKQLKACLLENSIKAYNNFLAKNYLASEFIKQDAIHRRDELEYIQTRLINLSDSTYLFIVQHPLSIYKEEAFHLFERQIFAEITSDRKEESYIRFINSHAKNSNLNNAYDALIELYRSTKNKNGIINFLKNYPNAHHRTEAWQLLFTLSVKSFTKEELENFITNYPEFPFRNSILKEMQLHDLFLIPVEVNERIGFVDTSGKIIIKPIYNEAGDFTEGLSIVHKGDSVFFVNKENENTIGRIFTDALPFHNGLAPVKVKDNWFLINRLGEIKSDAYIEFSEMSEDLYIVKKNNFYCAIDEYGQKTFPCKFDKLGDFKNGCAYYQMQNKYGFITINGYQHKPEFEWISDFDSSDLAIFKHNNKFGLINKSGTILLQAKFDLIQTCNNSIYLLVLNNMYGFYSGNGCYLSELVYDYEKERNINSYCNGGVLKLIKKKNEALMDLNGKFIINFNSYQELYPPYYGLIRIKKNNKYGYLDKNLAPVISAKYISATNFEDSTAIVATKKGYQLINTKGEILIDSKFEIKKICENLFLLETDEGNLISNQKGEQLYSNISSYELYGKYVIIYLDSGQIKIVRT